MKNVIRVDSLGKEFKVKKDVGQKLKGNIFRSRYKEITALKSISFDISKGEFVGFVGPNGAGKTTTMKCLCGLLKSDMGKVEVLGYEPIKRKRDFLRKISFVMGNRSQLWWELPAKESFLLNKEIYEVNDNEYKKVLSKMIDILEIGEIIDIPVRKLSLGERMKCELVVSLLHSPQVIFLDEPTLGLDVISQQSLRNFLREYREKYNATIVLTSHNMQDVTDLCERIIMIDKGKIMYDGKLESLTSSFIRKKYLKFVLKNKVKAKEIARFGEIVSFDGTEGVILIEKNNPAENISKFLDTFEVADIDVEEPSLEDVIKEVFSDKNKQL